MYVRFCFAALATVTLSASAALAGPITFSGVDNGVRPGGAFTNSNAADSALVAAAGSAGSVITFEGLPTGSNPYNLAVGAGVTLTVTGNPHGAISAQSNATFLHGFNTTAGGANWLQMFPAFESSTGASATFTFATGIQGFGFFMTDAQETFPGDITVTYTSGATEVLGVAENDDTGGVAYFGFYDPSASIESVTINGGGTAVTRDLWGLDDVRFITTASVPDGGTTLALLGCALAGVGALRRKLS